MKDIEALKNIAPYISVPLFVIACIRAGFLQESFSEIENETAVLALQVIFYTIGIYFAYMEITRFIFRYATYGNTHSIELMPLPVIVGFICLGFGLYGVGSLIPALDLPASPLNIFWHLGALCYGFFLLTAD
jgi:hypothetical protein